MAETKPPPAVTSDGEIVEAQPLYEGWETWEQLLNRVSRELLVWIPKATDTAEIRAKYEIDYEVPNPVGGTLVDITEIEGEYKPYRLLILEPPAGGPLDLKYQGALWAVHCFHQVLQREVQRRLDRGHLLIDDLVAIAYQGTARRHKAGLNAAYLYRMEVRHPWTTEYPMEGIAAPTPSIAPPAEPTTELPHITSAG